MVDQILVFATGSVLGATLCPGAVLCVPGLVLLGAAIVPLIVAAVLALLLGAVAAVPYLLVRSASRGLRRAFLGPPASVRAQR